VTLFIYIDFAGVLCVDFEDSNR